MRELSYTLARYTQVRLYTLYPLCIAAGGIVPRRIICCGYCFGGGIATLAATWASLQVPTADVRCITFGVIVIASLIPSNP